MNVVLPAGARAPSSSSRPSRLAVSHLERALAGSLRTWAARALYTARLEHAGARPRPLVDVLLYGPGRRA